MKRTEHSTAANKLILSKQTLSAIVVHTGIQTGIGAPQLPYVEQRVSTSPLTKR